MLFETMRHHNHRNSNLNNLPVWFMRLTTHLPCHSCRMPPSASTMRHSICLFFTLLCFYSSSHPLMVASQQSYPFGDHTTHCEVRYPEDAGYRCEPSIPACDTLAYFRVQSGTFSSLPTIAKHLNTTPSAIAQASNLSTATPVFIPGQGLYIPFSCNCNGGSFSSYNVTYTIMPGDTFVTVSNSTYEGLTTCRAIQDANPHLIPSKLEVGNKLLLPLRCACPSPAQGLGGIKYLVTYPIGNVPETVSSIAGMFRLNATEFLLANNITNRSAIFFAATTVLLPFKEKPAVPPNVSFASPLMPLPRDNMITIHIVAASATSVIFILIILTAVFYNQKLKTKHADSKTIFLPNAIASPNVVRSENSSPPIDLFQVMSDLAFNKRLIVFRYNDINQATQGFDVSSKIKGAMHRGTIEGLPVAIKKIARDATQEVRILQTLHHANIVSLLGVCLASPSHSYLVYEYAEGGSLNDWLFGRGQSVGLARGFKVLQWRDRLQITFDVSLAMEYIHEHTSPRYVHSYINSSNILLDSNMRGKLANFSLAKEIEGNGSLDVVSGMNFVLPISLQHVGIEHVPLQEHGPGAKASPMVDVFAFGLVLLEILSGQENAYDNVEAIRALLKGHASMEKLGVWMYPGFDNDVHHDCAYGLAMLANSCVAPNPSARPSARTVAFTLSKLRNACLSEHMPF